jgi:hypothetical protein
MRVREVLTNTKDILGSGVRGQTNLQLEVCIGFVSYAPQIS